MSRVAIVAALEREVRPLVRDWQVKEKDYEGRRYRFFEKNECTLVCGGIGAAPARRAAEAVLAIYKPNLIYSAGFAGALAAGLAVGAIVQPHRLVNAADGSSVSLDRGEGVLVSFGSVANSEQKIRLRDSFGALAVDMEAAAVSRAAELRGVEFAVVKAISDEWDFEFPSMERFVDSNGKFLETRFALFAALRPWLWLAVARLARNSHRASLALCEFLEGITRESRVTGSTMNAIEETKRA
jgi:adenosylhomocysteine nucleosidase